MNSNMFIFLIDAYQRFKRRLGFPSACRFFPTCSEYTKQAINSHGIIRGSVLGLKRILKCHPFNPGGLDPTP